MKKLAHRSNLGAVFSHGEVAGCCHQLRLSTEHLLWISIIAPSWGSVNLSQSFTHHPPKLGWS